MPGPTLPVDIVNRALDECGVDEIGDLEEGSRNSKVAIRIYDPTLRQLHAAAHWNFARRQEPMILLADASGVNSDYTDVLPPWSYMYEWPVDCVHARFVPYTDQTITGRTVSWNAPAPFIVASKERPNDPGSQWYLIEGHDPEQTRVVLTNQLGASLVYTGLIQYPDAWDPLFEQAMVAVLAARLAMPLIEDKKFAREVRQDNVGIAKASIDAARVRDGDEGWTVANHTPDWIRARTSGAPLGGIGVLWYPWSSMPFVEDAGGSF